jgi:hypothetical protein
VYEALSDYMSTILCDWYRHLASWSPESAGDTEMCLECASSPFREHESIAGWPHDVVHPLLTSLTSAMQHVAEFVTEAQPAGAGRHAAPHVDMPRGRAISRYSMVVVCNSLTANARDIADVLEHCVTPQLDNFVIDETARAIAFFESA